MRRLLKAMLRVRSPDLGSTESCWDAKPSIPVSRCNEKENKAVGGRWKLISPIGTGGCGTVYRAHDGNGNDFAVKLNSANFSKLSHYREVQVYRTLQNSDINTTGIPKMHYCGKHNDRNFLVMDCLGLSLQNRLKKTPDGLHTQDVLRVAVQALSRIELVHKHGFIHGDIKPDNFVYGRHENDTNLLYLIDFGLSKQYRDRQTGEHLPRSETKFRYGSPAFMSLNAHRRVQLSRRDDLESLGYMLVYLFSGSLPWIKTRDCSMNELHETIFKQKANISYDALFEGMLPEFKDFFRYVQNLSFEAKPDYSGLRHKFRSALVRL